MDNTVWNESNTTLDLNGPILSFSEQPTGATGIGTTLGATGGASSYQPKFNTKFYYLMMSGKREVVFAEEAAAADDAAEEAADDAAKQAPK